MRRSPSKIRDRTEQTGSRATLNRDILGEGTQLGDRSKFILGPPIPSREDLVDLDRDMGPSARLGEKVTVKSDPTTRGKEMMKNKTKNVPLTLCLTGYSIQKPSAVQNAVPAATHTPAQHTDLFCFEFLGDKQL